MFRFKPKIVNSADVVSVVLEFIANPKLIMKLRLVSKTFDLAVFRIKLIKLHQTRAVLAHYQKEVDLFDPNSYLDDMQMHLITLECRREKLLRKLNTVGAVC